MNSERFNRGSEIIWQMDGKRLGGGEGEKITQMDEMDPLGKYTHEYVYGDIYCRNVISMRERLLINVTVVATLGGCESLLKDHMIRAMKNGVTREDLEEVILLISAYAGFPRAILAKRMLDEIPD